MSQDQIMILHTVNKSPFDNSCFSDCLALCSANNSVLLIEDGVYAATTGTRFSQLINERGDVNFYSLAADVSARGLEGKISTDVTLIDDSGFVKLVEKHQSMQSWY